MQTRPRGKEIHVFVMPEGEFLDRKNNMTISCKEALIECLKADSKNYKSQVHSWKDRLKCNLTSTPISEQKHIWAYIKHMRYVEYYSTMKDKNRMYLFPYLYHLKMLRKESHITGFQIEPGTCGKGLTIWHWGSIIVNGGARLGENCTLYPGVLIGQKAQHGGNAIIGSNVFIGSGTKIIGAVKIGDNVTIGQNCVIVKDIEEGQTVVMNHNLRIINRKE